MKSKNKKTLLERVKSTIITILVVIIILLSKCNGDEVVVPYTEPKIVTETVVKIDTVTGNRRKSNTQVEDQSC